LNLPRILPPRDYIFPGFDLSAASAHLREPLRVFEAGKDRLTQRRRDAEKAEKKGGQGEREMLPSS